MKAPDSAIPIETIVAAARAEANGLALDEEAFASWIEAVPARTASAAADNAAELALAFRCARGDEAAMRVFERSYLAPLASTLPSPHRGEAAEILQILRERMLLSDGARPPRIDDFTGRGRLAGWLKVAAVRVALNLERDRRREVPLDEDTALAERAAGDLEIDDLKRRYSQEFRAAFTAGLAAIAPRERTLLRQHYLDGLRMDAIAAAHHVHRITVVRWMSSARESLERETRRELGARLRVDHGELESILRLIESRMDVSIRAFLGE